jgi:lipopolysaccharide/colanic/teichoic acid biosynthesis glycosyltransferase
MMKRAFDIVTSLIGLVLLLPMFAVVTVAVVLEDGWPALYLGRRVGRDQRPFRLWKFRTMIRDADKVGPSSTSGDDARLTRVGRVLRQYKIDELPQLVNVLKGDMSMVGPRPQVAWAVELYTAEERALLSVRPGITDYASITFSNEAEILRGSTDPDRDYLEKIAPEKIRLGLEYVRRRTFLLDLRIVLATVWALVGGSAQRIVAVPEKEPVRS